MSSKPRSKKQPPVVPIPPEGPTWRDKLASRRVLLIAFAAAVLLFYAKPLFDSNASIQWDAVDVHYSSQKYFADHATAGRLPLWTPYLFSGFPFLADPQVGAWYPLNWPFFLVGVTPRAIEWELALHCLLALAGGYLLARQLSASRAAAVFAGVFFAFSGFFTGHSSHVGIFQAAALLPWLLWTGLRAARSLRTLPALLVVAGCVVLTGHFQTALYSFFALALFLAADFLVRRESWRRTVLVLAATAVAAFALSAVMVLPGLELTGQSGRAAADYAHAGEGSLVPGALMTLVSADRYGAPEAQNYTGPADITQFYLYAGFLLLPLAVWGAIASGRRWQSPGLRPPNDVRLPATTPLRSWLQKEPGGFAIAPNLAVMALALVVPAVWYAFGRPLGLYSLVSLLPGFKSVRAPIHIWFVAALGLALLAAAGVEALRARFRSPWIPLGLLLVVGADLYYWNMDHNALAYARTSFEDQYGAAQERFKTVAQPVTRDPLHRLYASFDSPGFGPLNGALENRIEVTYGYNPLGLVRYSKYLEAAKSNPRLLDSLAVTAQLNETSGFFAPRPAALPRVYAPEIASPVRGAEEAAARLPSLDPAHEAVVEGLPAALPSNGGAKVRITGYEGDLYRVRYEAERPTLLRVAVPYFPGWRAEVDGRAEAVLLADEAMMGVVVPAGSHELTLRYRSTWFLTGAMVSLLSWIAVLGWMGWTLKRRV
jgi:hypothetical protein